VCVREVDIWHFFPFSLAACCGTVSCVSRVRARGRPTFFVALSLSVK
jgi:hypothetical protein